MSLNGLRPVLLLDELADPVLDPERGDVLAEVAVQGLVEEILEGEDARAGVIMYLLATTRPTVDSWTPISWAISMRVRGWMNSSPFSKKSLWRSTMKRATR